MSTAADGRLRLPSHRAAAALGSVLLMTSCASAPPVATLFNRTSVNLALAPGVVVSACSSRSFTQAELDRAVADLNLATDESWVPVGAVNVGLNGFAAPRPAPGAQLVIVVPGGAPPEVLDRAIGEAELPKCGGEPVTP